MYSFLCYQYKSLIIINGPNRVNRQTYSFIQKLLHTHIINTSLVYGILISIYLSVCFCFQYQKDQVVHILKTSIYLWNTAITHLSVIFLHNWKHFSCNFEKILHLEIPGNYSPEYLK